MALLLPSILAPLIVIVLAVVALIAALNSLVTVVSVFALVCLALCLEFCVTTRSTPTTNSFLTTNLLFHSL